MEGNKKKKNKNKKGNQKANQSKAAEEVVVLEPDHGSNHHGQGTSVRASDSDADTEKQKIQEEQCVKLQDEIRQLGEEKGLWIQKEANLDEKIRLLQSGLETCIQKEIILEEKLNGLLIENDTSIEKQVILENKVKHIEGIGDSWNQKEMTMKEQIIRLDEVNVDLQKQVRELTESKDNLSQENQHLKESLTALELRIHYLESNASFYGSSAVKITEVTPAPTETSAYTVHPAFEAIVTGQVERECLMLEWMDRWQPFTAKLREAARRHSDGLLDIYFPHHRPSTVGPDPTAHPTVESNVEPTEEASEESDAEMSDEETTGDETDSEQPEQVASAIRAASDSEDSDYQPGHDD